MKEPKSASDFRRSLEARLLNRSQKSGEAVQRIRQKVAFDRLLARIFHTPRIGNRFVLKGGYAMELRFESARATRDVDLTFLPRPHEPFDEALDLVREAALIDLEDFFTFQLVKSPTVIKNAPYGGVRCSVLSTVNSKEFVRFSLDVGSDIIVSVPEALDGIDWLGFASISAPVIRVIPYEQQFAEKIHAYSFPRGASIQNSRVKDLVDLTLLVQSDRISPGECWTSLEKVFKSRDTHNIPKTLQEPPKSWPSSFARLADECGLSPDLNEAYLIVKAYYENLGP